LEGRNYLVIGENVHWEITDIYIKSAIIKLQARPGSQGFLVIANPLQARLKSG